VDGFDVQGVWDGDGIVDSGDEDCKKLFQLVWIVARESECLNFEALSFFGIRN
jgi:hypothetical protein